MELRTKKGNNPPRLLENGNGSSYNAADAEANQEMAEIFHRKKKVKRKKSMRL